MLKTSEDRRWNFIEMEMEMEIDKSKTKALYQRIIDILNRLTPGNFDTLLAEVRTLPIDTLERLQGVMDIIFEKAVEEPNFSAICGLMCRELALMKVPHVDNSNDGKEDKDKKEVINFRKLLVARCQKEFEKQSNDESERNEKVKEMEECTDPGKKMELQYDLEEYDRKMLMRSIGNIKFIGELFKQQMLTVKIILRCLQYLLGNKDEESLQCLCTLLTTVGKELEDKRIDLSKIFATIEGIVDNYNVKENKISDRVKFMLQDVINLRKNKWIKTYTQEDTNMHQAMNYVPITSRGKGKSLAGNTNDKNAKDAHALLEYMQDGNLSNVKYFYTKLGDKKYFEEIFDLTPLQCAVELANLHLVELLVELGADIFENSVHCTLLPITIAENSKKRCSLGSNKRITLDTNNSVPTRVRQGTALDMTNIALYQDKTISAKKYTDIYDFLEGKTRELMNILDDEGNSPLTVAVKRQCKPAVEFLLKKGADITLKGPNGVSPLFAAVETANPDILSRLSKRVPRHEVNKDLHFAIEKQVDWKIVYQFFKIGANIGSTNVTGKTALHLAAKIYNIDLFNHMKDDSHFLNSMISFAIKGDDFESVQYFIEHQSNLLNNKEIFEYFFKAMTIRNMPVDLFNLTSLNNLELLRRCFDDLNFKALNLKCLNEHNNDGDTLLILAIRENNFELVKFLIELGANVCKSNKNGIVPLDQAVSSGHYDICSYLLQNGAEFTVKTALNRAIRGKLPQFVKLFVVQGVNLNTTSRFENLPFVESLLTKDIEIVKILIENGANVDTTNYDGKIPLDLAIELGFTAAVKLFIENGISPNRMAKSTGETLLHKYLDDLDFEMVFFLINHNVDVNKVDQNNECALVKVARMKNAQLLNTLLKNGADPFCEHFKDDPLLSIAATEEYFPVAVFLIEKGANIRGSKQQLQNFATNNVNFAMYLEEIGIDLAAQAVAEMGNEAAEDN